MFKIRKIRNNVIRKFAVRLHKIQTVELEEWMKKGYLEKCWNGARLEEENKEVFEIRGCRK